MDENSIFKSPDEIGEEKDENPIQTQPQPEPVVTQGPPPGSSLFRSFNIWKILLGVVIVVVIGFVFFQFILPRFSKGPQGNVTLTYWGLWAESSEIQPIIDDFEKDNPSIKIDYIKQDINQYSEKLTVRSNNGNGPDIFSFHNSWTSMLSDLLVPVPESVVSKSNFEKNYYPVVKKDLVKNGAIYGIPLQMDTLNLFVNKELLESVGLSVPTTWIEFMDDARELTVKDENNNIKTAGAAMGAYENVENSPDIASMLFVQNGVNLNDISSNVDAVSEALNFYSSFAVPPANVWDNTLDNSSKMFASGSLAMYFGFSRDFLQIKKMNPKLSFEVHPAPSLPDRIFPIASYWAEGVSSKSKHQKEAFLFLQYLAKKEVEQKLFDEVKKKNKFGFPFARVDLADSIKDSEIYPFIKDAKFAVSSYFASGTDDNGLSSEMNGYLRNAVDAILQGTSPSEAAGILSQGFSQTLSKYSTPAQ